MTGFHCSKPAPSSLTLSFFDIVNVLMQYGVSISQHEKLRYDGFYDARPVKAAIAHGFITLHQSGVYLMFTQAGADLFA
jgi:hypothetical protein